MSTEDETIFKIEVNEMMKIDVVNPVPEQTSENDTV